MINMPMNAKCKNRKGQAILFAIVGVTIALAIGVTVASRNLSSISRVSRSDTSERAFAAAEGGIEKMLVLSGSELESLKTPTAASCALVGGAVDGGYCEITYPNVSGDPIVSTADVKVETYTSNDEASDGTPYLALDIDNGNMAELDLRGYTGKIILCWDNASSAIYYTKYNYVSSCSVSKGALRANALGNTSTYGFEITDAGNSVFPRCSSQMNFSTTSYDGMRIRALYGRTRVGIFPTTSLPTQGYKLTSLGKILNQNEVIKKVVAYRSYPFMSSIFDSAILSVTGQIN